MKCPSEEEEQFHRFRDLTPAHYPLEAILALGIADIHCGYNTYGAMADGGKIKDSLSATRKNDDRVSALYLP
ncbi:MAG: hypothetical protein H8F28_07855 [Fibrella sp.]|nr:hypothetical protein [Armatimonadota bacterium]